jgi:bifunctional ADP-heptose synthase (sugar kinase/adenylyltransferase)
VAVVGDFCLDRYLEIDPSLEEVSIETGRRVHNVVRVRSIPGAAGTIVNNLSALGVGRITPVGFCGDDGEGYELRRGLEALPGVGLDHFVTAPDQRTFTYAKPLVIRPDQPAPEELDRLDTKNWSATPPELGARLARAVRLAVESADAILVLEQVERAGTGAIVPNVLDVLAEHSRLRPEVPILADSRRGLRGWPALWFKMNAVELMRLTGMDGVTDLEAIREQARGLARSNNKPVFVSLSERGILAAEADGRVLEAEAHPARGPIDVVGAGDAVSAHLAASLAGGASLADGLRLAMAAASVVVHKLGTTGTASQDEVVRVMEEG